MNILWISENYPPSMGGVQQYLSNTILNMGGCHSVLVTKALHNGGTLQADEQLRMAGHTIYRFHDWPSVSDVTVIYKCPLSLLKLCLRTYGVIRRESISQIVIGHVPFAFLLVLLILKTVTLLPVALIFHGEEVPVIPLKSNFIRRLLIRLADLHICNSQFTKDILTQFCGPLRRTFVANPGVEDKFFAAVDCSELRSRLNLGTRRIVYTVGRLDERKGHDLVIEALPAVIKQIPDILYLIGGTGSNYETLKQKVDKLHLTDYVRFCGKIAPEDIVMFHQLGDVFVMPNRTLDNGDTEGFGIVFLEANACGKPVIGGDSGGVADAVENGVTGFLVNPYETADLCSRIICLLSDSSKAAKMGDSGRQRAWHRFRWPILAKNLENVLMRMVFCNSLKNITGTYEKALSE